VSTRNGQSVDPEATAGTCGVLLVDKERVQRICETMLTDSALQDVADTFKMLATPSRVRIIRALEKEELCVCDLSQVLGLSISATSHQLQLLRKMRLVRCRMDGKLAYYTLRDRFVPKLLADCVEHLTAEEVAT
jgi:DNA-binding transcriptional ArsR family regulator